MWVKAENNLGGGGEGVWGVDHKEHIGPPSSLYSVLYAVVWIPLVTKVEMLRIL